MTVVDFVSLLPSIGIPLRTISAKQACATEFAQKMDPIYYQMPATIIRDV